ncbi:helix-turn-helix transcriptional regulator [Pseudomonas sp. PDM14]|uniref:helix-turn-helix domain-containing protein n=1 Tax=Pseudomonas sp. PDM14 TaxID=2769288 RepID=UPI00177BB85F|nr:helix-turn-helix transcriptional regulator [Pseudomonas sp. PDM14]MBD9483757.1 helix-turn-helix transcriptional regulator [Pseudomonas sp. PDM14]
MSTLSKRLKEARLRAGLSQEQLGLQIGLEPASASTRMNRYELGKRSPDLDLVERIAEVLGLPAAYFYAVQDEEAELLRQFSALSAKGKKRILDVIAEVS